MRPDEEDDYIDDDLALDGEFDGALDCSQFLDGGVIVCGAVGSEWCDFECPMRCDLGLTPKQAEQRAIDEYFAEQDALRKARGNTEYDSWASATVETKDAR